MLAVYGDEQPAPPPESPAAFSLAVSLSLPVVSSSSWSGSYSLRCWLMSPCRRIGAQGKPQASGKGRYQTVGSPTVAEALGGTVVRLSPVSRDGSSTCQTQEECVGKYRGF